MVEPTCTGPFRIGDDIIGYKVLGLLGAGGHAFVYESKDPYLGNAVAIKVIQKPPGGSDLVSRGRAEAMILTELQHPNVVRVHLARPLSSSMICIVMEKLEGISLRHMLRLYKRLTITEALRVVRQIADALSAAHKMKVIHRDIKPENVFVLPPDNKVKVLDFGIAKLAGLGLTTNKFRFHGTPIYMAPEQLRDGTASVRSDVFQLVLVAFEMMTGKHPYLADSDLGNIEAVILRQIQRPTPALSSFVPDASASVDYLIQKGTAKDPNQRHQSMDELIVDIDMALAERARTHPGEAKRIRYLDVAAIEAALALDSAHDPWAEDEPEESVDTEAAAPPAFSVAPVVPSVAQTAAAPTPVTPPGATPPRRTSMGLGPDVGRAESIASLTKTVAKRSPSALAPTVEISRESTASAPSELAPTPVSAPAPQSSSISARPAHTSDGYTTAPSNRATKGITPTLLLSGAIIGGVIGLASSWPSIQQAYERRLAQPHEQAPESSVQVPVKPPPSGREPSAPSTPLSVPSAGIASPLPLVQRPEEPPTEAAPSAAVAPAGAVVAAPSRPKKPTIRYATPDNETLLFTTHKATKADIARMQKRLREFKADMEREAREKKAREANQ